MAGHVQVELGPRNLAKVDVGRHHGFAPAQRPGDQLAIL